MSPLDVAVWVPAPGQGALALEGRRDRPELAASLADFDDPATSLAVRAERALLAGLGGGCREPVGALGAVDGEALHLVAFAASADGAVAVRARAHRAGRGPGGAWRGAGGEDRCTPGRRMSAPLAGRRVVVTRPADQSQALVERLTGLGADVVALPLIDTVPIVVEP